MGEQLSMLDTMFLELEQFDESAHMHIGAALVFEVRPAKVLAFAKGRFGQTRHRFG